MTNKDTKRGWLFDALMLVGQYEAGLTHSDEQVCNIYHDMKENSGSLEEIERLTSELGVVHDLIRLDYEARATLLDDLFHIIPGANRHWYCHVKHHACQFALAAETYHARGCDPGAEQALTTTARALALVCSQAFNIDVMDCLRCLNDAMNSKTKFDQGNTTLVELPMDTPEVQTVHAAN